jgi:hypothetical protein
MRVILFVLFSVICTSALAQSHDISSGGGKCANDGQCSLVSAATAGPASKIAVGASASRLPKWCVNVHLGLQQEAPEQIVTLMHAIGANCVRDSLDWEQIERKAGFYSWSSGAPTSYQKWWSVFCGAGFTAIMVPTYNNPLYSGGDRFQIITPGANTAAYVNFNVAAAKHFASMCPGMVVELFNEENLVIWTKTQWGGGAYALMAETTAAAIKAAEPSIKVWSGGLSPGPGMDPADFGLQMVNAVTLSNIDAYAMHPYNYNQGSPSETRTPQGMLQALRRFNQATNRQPKPTPITEHNFPVHSLGDGVCTRAATATTQGIYLGWSMLLAVAGKVPAYAAYELVNEGIACSADSAEWGLFFSPTDTSPLGIRPTGVAFSRITKLFKDATTYDVVYYPETSIYEITIRYSGRGPAKAVIQSPNDASSGTPLLAPVIWSEDMGSFGSVTATDVLGNAVPLTVSGSSVSFPLSQIDGPVIVQLP